MEFIDRAIYMEEERVSRLKGSCESCSFLYRFVNKSCCVYSESRMRAGLRAWTKDINIYKTKKTTTATGSLYTCSGSSWNNKKDYDVTTHEITLKTTMEKERNKEKNQKQTNEKIQKVYSKKEER